MRKTKKFIFIFIFISSLFLSGCGFKYGIPGIYEQEAKILGGGQEEQKAQIPTSIPEIMSSKYSKSQARRDDKLAFTWQTGDLPDLYLIRNNNINTITRVSHAYSYSEMEYALKWIDDNRLVYLGYYGGLPIRVKKIGTFLWNYSNAYILNTEDSSIKEVDKNKYYYFDKNRGEIFSK